MAPPLSSLFLIPVFEESLNSIPPVKVKNTTDFWRVTVECASTIRNTHLNYCIVIKSGNQLVRFYFEESKDSFRSITIQVREKILVWKNYAKIQKRYKNLENILLWYFAFWDSRSFQPEAQADLERRPCESTFIVSFHF